MARLIVEAFSSEPIIGDISTLLVGVSVSRADDGKAVTGLKAENFRVSAPTGFYEDFKVAEVYEWKWEPADVKPAGCYLVHINMTSVQGLGFFKGQRYVFGIQVQTFDLRSDTLPGRGPRSVIDQGQTVFELISTGSRQDSLDG
jgi:hypothetical protein